MGKPLSMDLRRRALAAVDAGMSRRAAAGRFGVSVSSVIRWDAQRRLTGSFTPKPQGGQHAGIQVLEGSNTIVSIEGVADARQDIAFTTEAKTYRLYIGQLMRAAAPQPFRILVSVE